MNTLLPTLAIISMSLIAFTANAISIEDEVINTPTAVDTLDQRYQNSQYGFSFSYPQSWTVEKTEKSGHQSLEITSPDKFKLALGIASQGDKKDCKINEQKVAGSDEIQILSNPLTIHLSGDKDKNTANHAYVLSSSDPCPNWPFIFIPGKGNISIELYYENLPEKPLKNFQSNDYQTAKDILSSISLTGL